MVWHAPGVPEQKPFTHEPLHSASDWQLFTAQKSEAPHTMLAGQLSGDPGEQGIARQWWSAVHMSGRGQSASCVHPGTQADPDGSMQLLVSQTMETPASEAQSESWLQNVRSVAQGCAADPHTKAPLGWQRAGAAQSLSP